MIEKLERHIRIEKGLTQDIKISCPPEQPEIVSKINKLIDVFNELQERMDDHDQAFDDCARDITKAETMLKNINTTVGSLIADSNTHEKQIGELQEKVNKMAQKAEPEYKNRNVKQAEKWMYCLCRFWNDGCDSYYGELVNIDTKVSSDAPFERDTGDWYQCCEPVKPDDDIIYKGERDENI